MKKLLVIAFVLALGAVAFADETPATTTGETKTETKTAPAPTEGTMEKTTTTKKVAKVKKHTKKNPDAAKDSANKAPESGM